MEWLRWYHGAVSDDKWPLIARKSGQPVAIVIAIWAALLECASQDDSERGSVRSFDPESIDALLQIEDGTTQAVLDALSCGKKPRIADGRIVNWSKRQPLRERDDDKSTERVRQHRERQKVLQGKQNCDCNANVTPVERQETPRSDKIREEKSKEINTTRACARESIPSEPQQKPKKAALTTAMEDFPRFWDAYPKKAGKALAEKAWAKANGTKPPIENLLEILARFKQSHEWGKDGGQFIPYPATWLNQRRWEDENIGNAGKSQNFDAGWV